MAPLAFLLDDNGQWRKAWGVRLLKALEAAGPAFMKWGQWAAARPDILPPDFCAILEALHQDAPAHAYGYTKRVLEEDMGHSLDEMFVHFDSVPLASGTIGQVHAASLSERGAEVLNGAAGPASTCKPGDKIAIKVRHPDVEEAITYDFIIMKAMARLANLFPSLEWLHLDEMMWQFETILCGQVDFNVESTKLEHFNYNFRMWKHIEFPKPLWSSSQALIESYEEGVSLQHYINRGDAMGMLEEGQEETAELNKRLAKLGLTAVLKMMVVDNLIHADLHPGNILVRELPISDGTLYQRMQALFGYKVTVPQVVLVDAGMTTNMQEGDSHNLVSFFKALSIFNGHDMAESMIGFSYIEPGQVQETFVSKMDNLMAYYRGQAESNSWVAFNECLATCMECVRESRMQIEGNVCTVIVTSMMLAELQTRLDSDCHVMQVLNNALLCKSAAIVSPLLGDLTEWYCNQEAITLRPCQTLDLKE